MSDHNLPRQQPLTKEEIAGLRLNSFSNVIKNIVSALLWAAFIIACITFAVLFSLWKWLAPSFGVLHPADYQTTFIILSATIAFLFILRIGFKDIKYFIELKKKNAPEMDDLKNGYALVEEFTVTRAVEISEYEDEGTGFFLELSDGRVLCVTGQDLYPYAHDSEAQPEEGIADECHLFPQNKIEYRYTPLGKRRLLVTGKGEALRPYGIVQSHKGFFKKDKKGVRTYTGPEDGIFYNGPMERVLESFSYKLQNLN